MSGHLDDQTEACLQQARHQLQMGIPRRSRSLGYRRLPRMHSPNDSIPVSPEVQRSTMKLSLLPLHSSFSSSLSPGSPASSTASDTPATPTTLKHPELPTSPITPVTPASSISMAATSPSQSHASHGSVSVKTHPPMHLPTHPPTNTPPHTLHPLDSSDPMVDMSWLRTFPIFGFSPRHPSDPRYQAIVKFNAVIMQHGVGDLKLGDFLLALSVYATLVDRSSKNVVRFAKAAMLSPSPQSSTTTITPDTSNTLPSPVRRRTAPASYPSDQQTQSPRYRAYQYHQSRALPSLSAPVIRHGRALRRALRRASSTHTSPLNRDPPWTSPCSSTVSKQIKTKAASCNGRHPCLNSSMTSISMDNCDPDLSTATLPDILQPTLAKASGFTTDDDPGNSSEQDDEDLHRLRRWSLPDDVLSRGAEWQQKGRNDEHLPSIQVHLLHHMMRHADSIYGLPLTVASAPGISLTRLRDRAIVCRLTGILNTDVFQADFRTKPFNPAYYIAADHRVDAVVICIRGTANIVDTLTDVAATQDPFVARRFPTPSSSPATSWSNLPDLDTGCVGQDGAAYVRGYGHAGVLRSARNLYQNVREIVLDVSRKYPNYTIVTTGHSLGGAIAAVLALLFRDDVECPNAVSIAFGPPPCVTYDLAEQTASMGMTIVNGPDIVPRLSVALLVPLFATARYVADLPRARKALLAMGVKHGVLDWPKLESVTQRRTVNMEKLHDGRRLFLPGRVVHLVSKEDDRDIVEDEKANSKVARKRSLLRRKRPVDVVRVSRAKFLYVKQRQKSMFRSHAPISYASALTKALHARNESALSLKEDVKLRKKADLVGGFTTLWAGLCNGSMGKGHNADQSLDD